MFDQSRDPGVILGIDPGLSRCGYGAAGKEQVQEMVARLCNLDAPPKPPDAADALALALCHLWAAPLRATDPSGRR